MNLPNKITTSRLFLSIVYFILLSLIIDQTNLLGYDRRLLIDVALVLFLLAAGSDFLDGYLARKYQAVTKFGRMADPFVDKILTCGSFILFLSFAEMGGFLHAWMVVIIISREFVIQAIRSMFESKNVPFGANFWGKQKMVLQCIAIFVILLYSAHGSIFGSWAPTAVKVVIWIMLISTIISGAVYINIARKLMKSNDL